MLKNILSDAYLEAVTEEVTGRKILKLALISHHLPVVAATYTPQGSRLCHENIANLPTRELEKCLSELDQQAVHKAGLQAMPELSDLTCK